MQQVLEHHHPSGFGTRRRKVLIVSDHCLVRHGLRLMLSAATPHLVIDDSRPLREVRAMLAQHDPDVVIADASTAANGLEQVRDAFSDPRTHAALLLISPSGAMPEGADMTGIRAAAIVAASGDAVELLDALQALDEPRRRDVQDHASPPSAAPALPSAVHVTPREREVIELITQGMCSKRIARALNISVTTVRTHRQRLMSKLGLRNSIEVAQFAARAFGGGPLAR